MAYEKGNSLMLFDRRGNTIAGTVLRAKKDGSLRIRGEDGKKYRRSPSEVRDLPENWEEVKKTMPYKPSKSKITNSPEVAVREAVSRELSPEEMASANEAKARKDSVANLLSQLDKPFKSKKEGKTITFAKFATGSRVLYEDGEGGWCMFSINKEGHSRTLSISGNWSFIPEIEKRLQKRVSKNAA